MRLAVIGSINMDQVITTDRIPRKGETVPGSDLKYVPGGKGANQAVAMARLGAEVSMFGCVGNDDNGRRLLASLSAENVDVSRVRVMDNVPTGLAVITVAEQDNVIVVVGGANALVDRVYIDSIAQELDGFDMVVMQHEIPLDTVHYVVSLCFEKHVPVVLNPAPAAKVPEEVLEKITYLTPNEHEARLIFGEDRSPEEILSQNREKLVVTQGAKGVSVCLKDGTVLCVPAQKAEVVDTTGAGDTLNGAFAVRMTAGDTMEEALKYANAAAGLSIEKFGAQGGMPTDAAVRERMMRTGQKKTWK